MHNAKYTQKKFSHTNTQFQIKILYKEKIKDRLTQQVRDKSARIPACIIDIINILSKQISAAVFAFEQYVQNTEGVNNNKLNRNILKTQKLSQIIQQ